MTLADALIKAKEGYSIRNFDHGLQILANNGEDSDGNMRFRLSGSLDGDYYFTSMDHFRSDWEIVGLGTTTAFVPNPVLEAEFGGDSPTGEVFTNPDPTPPEMEKAPDIAPITTQEGAPA